MPAVEPLVTWEMYGLGTTLAFCGSRKEHGFELTLTRDRATVFSRTVGDAGTLLKNSSEIRLQLQQLGYTTVPGEPSLVAAVPARRMS